MYPLISKNELKFYTSLLQKKYRKSHNLFLAEGLKIVKEAIESCFKIERVLVTEAFLEKESGFVKETNLSKSQFLIVKNKDFEKLADTKTPQGIVAVCKLPDSKRQEFTGSLIVALENISDPGNLGTIIRNCDWFGFKEILLSENCAEIFNPKVLRASMGSIFHLRIRVSKNFTSELIDLKKTGYKILIADLEGESIYNFELPAKSVIVFSNEAHGPSEKIREIADFKFTIPKYGRAESLNVASASAVILSEFARK